MFLVASTQSLRIYTNREIVDGALVMVSDDSNAAYYGKQLGPTDIILKKEGNNPASQDLRRAAASLIPQ